MRRRHAITPARRRYALAIASVLLQWTPVYAQSPSTTSNAVAPTVRIADGSVRGLNLPSGVRSFRGIPFAAPPVGELRWRPPQPATPWRTERAADRFDNQCMQTRQYTDMMFRNAGVSEDCLYLNVWTPANARQGSVLPVLVYFYGGGFTAGDGSEFRYDGESMAQNGIVVVTLSYRVGIFGFFSHPALRAESPEKATGNYGLMDQTAALRWVRANIAAFGGDPARVTIAGESAGSMSVSAQMASPLAKGLFARAIGESGALFPSGGPMPLREQTEQSGARFAEAVGAPTLRDLRELSSVELLELAGRQGMPRFGVNVDGWFLPQAPVEIFTAGGQARVPLLAGWNSEESSSRGLTQTPTADSAKAVFGRLFGDRAVEAANHFPTQSDAQALQSLTDFAGDRFIGYSTWKWLDAHSATGGQPVYRYYFAQPRPGARGAAHSAEIEYALGNLSLNSVYKWTDVDQRISTVMQKYFINFIKTGDPNGASLPVWPMGKPTSSGVTQRLRLGPDLTTETEPTARYKFLDQFFNRPRP